MFKKIKEVEKMSDSNGKACANCQHCRLISVPSSVTKGNTRVCHCDYDNSYIGYINSMVFSCQHWTKNKGGFDGTDKRRD